MSPIRPSSRQTCRIGGQGQSQIISRLACKAAGSPGGSDAKADGTEWARAPIARTGSQGQAQGLVWSFSFTRTSPPGPTGPGSPGCQTPAPSQPFAAPLARIPQARVSTPAPGPGRFLLREPIWVGCRLSGRMLRCTSDLPSHLAEQGYSSNQGLSIR